MKAVVLFDDLKHYCKMIMLMSCKEFSANLTRQYGKSILCPIRAFHGEVLLQIAGHKESFHSNVIGTFNLTSEWLLTVSNIDFSVRNGVQSNVSYNFKSNELSSTIRVENMEANALPQLS